MELGRDRVLDLPIRLIIDRRSSLIEDEDLAVLDECTRERDQRALPNRQVATLVVDRAVEREAVDRSARALLLDLVDRAINCVVLPVLDEVRPLERVPELRIIVGAKGVEVAAKSS